MKKFLYFFYPDSLDKFKKAQIYNGTVPIGLLNYNYNLMGTLAEDNNLINVSGLLFYDVWGLTIFLLVKKHYHGCTISRYHFQFFC
ncbi:MAG: hypothetical protein WKF68_02320 [Daejeonella sp.]